MYPLQQLCDKILLSKLKNMRFYEADVSLQKDGNADFYVFVVPSLPPCRSQNGKSFTYFMYGVNYYRSNDNKRLEVIDLQMTTKCH